MDGWVSHRAVQLQLPAQLGGIGEVAVMRHRHCTLDMMHLDGLAVGAASAAGGAVPNVSDGYAALAEL